MGANRLAGWYGTGYQTFTPSLRRLRFLIGLGMAISIQDPVSAGLDGFHADRATGPERAMRPS